MVTACVGLGSNLGDSRQQVLDAFAALDGLPQTHLLRRSRLYRTAPWGRVDQPSYINAAAALETNLEPTALLQALLGIERAAGRVRAERWGPRILDLDLLLYGDEVIHAEGLTVPHPHLAERAFVLLPLADVASQREVPGKGRVCDLLAAIDAGDCQPLDEP